MDTDDAVEGAGCLVMGLCQLGAFVGVLWWSLWISSDHSGFTWWLVFLGALTLGEIFAGIAAHLVALVLIVPVVVLLSKFSKK